MSNVMPLLPPIAKTEFSKISTKLSNAFLNDIGEVSYSIHGNDMGRMSY